jgi:hypothetical protein
VSTPKSTQLFDNCTPPVPSGHKVLIAPDYQLDNGGPLLDLSGTPGVHVSIEGPRLRLDPGDVGGVFPPPGSDNTAVDFLPHIVINLRTLPWERFGPWGKPPWLALITVKLSELNVSKPEDALLSTSLGNVKTLDPAAYNLFKTSMGLTDATPLTAVRLPVKLLSQILPSGLDEVLFLSHVKRVIYDQPRDVAIVIGNRLPSPGPPVEPHVALLVSLEQRSDLYLSDATGALAANDPTGTAKTTLIVLYSWSFTPTNEGDFEGVIRSIGIRPNGGVLRFGNLPRPADPGVTPLAGGFQPLLRPDGYFIEPLPHDQPEPVELRSPLCPFPFRLPDPLRVGVALRSDPVPFQDGGPTLDESYAAAFELGRLLALSNASVIQALRATPAIPERVIKQEAIVQVPVAMQRVSWVFDPPDERGDFTGLQQYTSLLQQSILPSLNQLGAVGLPAVSVIDLATATAANLAKQFPEVIGAGH